MQFAELKNTPKQNKQIDTFNNFDKSKSRNTASGSTVMLKRQLEAVLPPKSRP